MPRRCAGRPLSETLRLIREVDPEKPSARLAQSAEVARGSAAARRSEPARLLREVRGELDWIVMKALEKDRTRRYESASALARDVERYLQQEPVEAFPPTRRYRLGKFLRRHRMEAFTAAAGLLLLVAAVRGEHLAGRAGDSGREDRRGRERVPAERPAGTGRPREPVRRGPGSRPGRHGTDAPGPRGATIEGKFQGGAADGGGDSTDDRQGLPGARATTRRGNGSSSGRSSCTLPSLEPTTP